MSAGLFLKRTVFFVLLSKTGFFLSAVFVSEASLPAPSIENSSSLDTFSKDLGFFKRDSSYYIQKITAHWDLIFSEEFTDLSSSLVHFSLAVDKQFSSLFKRQPNFRTGHVFFSSPRHQASNALASFYITPFVQIFPSNSPSLMDLGSFFDWSQDTLIHELNHIYQISQNSYWENYFWNLLAFISPSPSNSRAIGLAIHRNIFLPLWILEGDSVLTESIYGSGGRLWSGVSRAFILAQIKEEKIDLKRLLNFYSDSFSSMEKYLHGGFFFAYLESRYGLEKIKNFFYESAKIFPIGYYGLNWSFKRAFNVDINTLFEDYKKYYSSLAREQKSAPGKALFTSKVFTPLNSDEESLYFLISDLKSPAELIVWSKKKKKVRKRKAYLPLGKVFKRKRRYFSASNIRTGTNAIEYTLIREKFKPVSKYNSQYVMDFYQNQALSLDMRNHHQGNRLNLGGEFYNWIHSSALVDKEGAVYYFKQEKEKRVLYKNKKPLVEFPAYFSYPVEVYPQEVYFIGPTLYGSSLFVYKEGQGFYRLSESDRIVSARKIRKNRFLAIEVGASHYEYKVISTFNQKELKRAEANPVVSNEVVSKRVPSNEIISDKVGSDKVTSEGVFSDKVILDKVASDEMVSDKVVSGEVALEEMASDKVVSGEVVSEEMASDKVVSGEVASDEVVSGEIVSDEVVSSEVASDEMVSDKVVSEKITSDKIVSKRIPSNKAKSKNHGSKLSDSKDFNQTIFYTDLPEKKKLSDKLDFTQSNTSLEKTLKTKFKPYNAFLNLKFDSFGLNVFQSASNPKFDSFRLNIFQSAYGFFKFEDPLNFNNLFLSSLISKSNQFYNFSYIHKKYRPQFEISLNYNKGRLNQNTDKDLIDTFKDLGFLEEEDQYFFVEQEGSSNEETDFLEGDVQVSRVLRKPKPFLNYETRSFSLGLSYPLFKRAESSLKAKSSITFGQRKFDQNFWINYLNNKGSLSYQFSRAYPYAYSFYKKRDLTGEYNFLFLDKRAVHLSYFMKGAFVEDLGKEFFLDIKGRAFWNVWSRTLTPLPIRFSEEFEWSYILLKESVRNLYQLDFSLLKVFNNRYRSLKIPLSFNRFAPLAGLSFLSFQKHKEQKYLFSFIPSLGIETELAFLIDNNVLKLGVLFEAPLFMSEQQLSYLQFRFWVKSRL